MCGVEGNVKDGTLIISLGGHIDSANAGTVEQSISKLREGSRELPLTLDAEKLEYISSAGLRILLRLRSDCTELEMINVSSAVYEVLEVTGFTEMIKVEKSFRCLSVENCEVIGQGANGLVYRIDNETIVKVYRNPDSLPEIKRETALARRAFVLGVPTAIPFDVVRVGEGYGSVFELLNAKSFAKLLLAKPENIDTYVELYVDLLKTIHSTSVKPGDMPSMKEVAVGWMEYLLDYLPKAEGEHLLQLVRQIPECDTMLHGDYHVKNIMMQDGEVLLIDMDTLCVGHPIFELAAMYLAYEGYGICDHAGIEKFLGLPYDMAQSFWNKSLRRYLNTSEEEVEKILQKAKLIGYARMMRRTIRRSGNTEAGKQLVEESRSRLLELLPKIDNLYY